MKKSIFGLLLMVVACSQPPPTIDAVQATIMGVSEYRCRTYLEDAHGHRGCVLGIWGNIGDTMMIRCISDERGVGFSVAVK